MNSSEKTTMELVPSAEHVCYVRCNFCNTVLAVGIPYRRFMETVTVKCGHCSNLSYLTTKPPLQSQCFNFQGLSGETKKGPASISSSTSTSTSTSSDHLSLQTPFVVKPPEKKHRLPSAYNLFMKEEIQRIKTVNPAIPHREAFSTAAKNWARNGSKSPSNSISEGSNDIRTEKASEFVASNMTLWLNK